MSIVWYAGIQCMSTSMIDIAAILLPIYEFYSQKKKLIIGLR